MDFLGSDVTVVNAARVSFENHYKNFTENDAEIIKYLAEHDDWTPFGHPQLQFKISAPIFVARQLAKHQVGLVWNETSRKYVDTDPELFLDGIPKQWRKDIVDKTQNLKKETITLSLEDQRKIERSQIFALEAYKMLLLSDVAPEQARMLLPQSMYTEWYWTGSLLAFSRICNVNLLLNAQEETRDVTQEIATLIKPHFPISWEHLMKNKEGYFSNA